MDCLTLSSHRGVTHVFKNDPVFLPILYVSAAVENQVVQSHGNSDRKLKCYDTTMMNDNMQEFKVHSTADQMQLSLKHVIEIKSQNEKK